jgi:hypothetical protein
LNIMALSCQRTNSLIHAWFLSRING